MDSDPEATNEPRNIPPGGPNPLATLDEKRLVRLVRRASRLRERDPDAFERLASRINVPVRHLRLLTDAWTEGGPAALTALGPGPADTDPLTGSGTELIVAVWCRLHFQPGTIQWDRWRNRVTIWSVRPTLRPVAHLRSSGPGRWHLYRKASQGDWWPVPVDDPGDLQACLRVVQQDHLRMFWKSEPGVAAQDPDHDTLR